MRTKSVASKEELYELGASRVLSQLEADGLSIDSLRLLTPLEWKVIHRKELPTGTSILRYAVTTDRAVRLLDKVKYIIPDATVRSLGATQKSILLELDLLEEGNLQIEIMFDPDATDEFDL
jgi:hypothetical protein